MEWLNLFVKLALWTATLVPPAEGLQDAPEWNRSAAVRLEPSPAGDESPFALDRRRLLYVGNGGE